MFREYLDVFLAVMLDDMIIYSDTPKEHVSHVCAVLEVLRKHKLYAKIEKCEFHVDTISFPGYRISSASVEMDPERVASLLD